MKKSPGNQTGVVLLVSLLILLLIGIVATTVTQTNLMQLQMAGNDESKADALQRALAVVDAVIDDASNTPVIGEPGYKLCPPGSARTDCDEKTLVVATEVIPDSSEYDYYVERMGPEEINLGAQSRQDEDSTGSELEYVGAVFEVGGSYDGTDRGLGATSVVQGVMLRIRRSPQGQ
jgi:Tfp pilus assembly protein PilX